MDSDTLDDRTLTPATVARAMALAASEELDATSEQPPHVPGHESGMRPVAHARNGLKLDLGQMLDRRWRIDAVLGCGGMAIVYAATHRNGSRVALKLLRHEYAHDPNLVSRFFAEGRLANLVDHPGIVRSLDDGFTEDGSPFLVLELVDGQSLEERLLTSGPLSYDHACDVTLELLDILSAAHGVGIVHRDVKPENVVLTRDGHVRLLDFGIARSPAQLDRTRTATDVILGTPAFMAPEQARGRWNEIDGRTDLFAVAATFYRAVTGNYLRDTDTPMEELGEAMQPLKPMREIAPILPKWAATWLDGGLAFRREDRFCSAVQMQDALRDARTAPLPLSRPRLASRPSYASLVVTSAPAAAPSASGLTEVPAFTLRNAPTQILSRPSLRLPSYVVIAAAACAMALSVFFALTSPRAGAFPPATTIAKAAPSFAAAPTSPVPAQAQGQAQASDAEPSIAVEALPVATSSVTPARSASTPQHTARHAAPPVAAPTAPFKAPAEPEADPLSERF